MSCSTDCNNTQPIHLFRSECVRQPNSLRIKLMQKAILSSLLISLVACQSVQETPTQKKPPVTTFVKPSQPAEKKKQPKKTEKVEEVTPSISRASVENITDSIMAEFNIRRGDLNEAYKRYLRIAKETQDKSTIKRAADIALALSNVEYIAETSAYWLTLDNQDSQAYDLQFQAFISTSQVQNASELLIKAINNNIELTFLNQEVNRNSREIEKIKTIYDALTALPLKYRNRVDVLMVETRLDFIQGNLQLAIEKAEKLKKEQGATKLSADIYLILAFSQNQTGLPIQAIKTLEIGLKNHPNNLRLLTPLLDFFLAQGQLESARSYFEKAELEPHQTLQLTMSYVGQMIENNFIRDALVQLQQIDYQSSGLADQFHFLKANALALINRKEEALTHLLKTNGVLKNNATQQAAVWLYELSQEEKINNMILTRIDRENSLDMVLEISSLHEEFERLDLADELLFLTLQQHPEKDNIRYKRALINEQIGLWVETEKELRYLIQQDPQNAQYLNALGYMLLSRHSRLDEAMSLIKSAYSLSKDDPAIIDSLGWGYFLQGNTRQAVHYLEDAWSLLNDPEIGAHLGEALWGNNSKRSYSIWQQSLELDSEHKILLETIRRLAPNSPLLDHLSMTQDSIKPTNTTDVVQETIQ